MIRQKWTSLVVATVLVIGGGAGAAWAARDTTTGTGSDLRGAVAPRVAAGGQPRTVTLRFHANEVRRNVVLDLGRRGSSAGDEIIENETLIRNGHVLGHDAVQCTLINPTRTPRFLVQCTVTWVLRRGQVTAVGAFSFDSIRAAITGGTGAFQGASGTATVTGTRNPRNDVDVLQLVLPPR